MAEDIQKMRLSVEKLDTAVRHMIEEDLPAQLERIKRALFGGELQHAAQEVHAVHGTAAFCRLESLRQSAAMLETSLSNNQKNAEHIRAFENNVIAVLNVLEHEKDNG